MNGARGASGLALALLLAASALGCGWSSDPVLCPRSRDERACTGFSQAQGATDRADDGADTGAAGAISRDAGPVDERAILVGEVVNARDLGGTPLGGGAVVAAGELFRGPPLAMLSDAGCDELARLGVRTIIDLRVETERAINPEAPCAQKLARTVLAPLPVPYTVSVADYIADLDATESIAAAFEVLGDEAAYPVYFHCTWGRDRTGILAAVILAALGAERQAIMDEYSRSRATVGAYPESLSGMLDELERRGGIGPYLEAARIPESRIATLRSRVIER